MAFILSWLALLLAGIFAAVALLFLSSTGAELSPSRVPRRRLRCRQRPRGFASGRPTPILRNDVAVGRSQVVRQRVLVPRSQVRILAPQPSRPVTQTRLAAVVMAAGLGTRMRSATPKHLHPLLGRRLVDWVIEAGAGARRRAARRRHLAGRTRRLRGRRPSPSRRSRAAPATPPLPRAERSTGFDGDVLVVTGDAATITSRAPRARCSRRTAPRGAAATVLSFEPPEPGAVRPHRPRRRRRAAGDRRGARRDDGGARDPRGQLRRSTSSTRPSSGRRSSGSSPQNAQGELYLTDTVARPRRRRRARRRPQGRRTRPRPRA